MSDSSDSTWIDRSSPPKARASVHSRSSSAASRGIPPLPEISGDLALEVFSHRSLRFAGAPSNKDYGDNARIAVLGSQVLQIVVTWCLFCKRPMLSADDIVDERKQCLSDANVDSWLTGYGLRKKLRGTEEAMSTFNTPEETRLLFESYVGAVYIEHGMGEVQNFIAQLIDPDSSTPDMPTSRATAQTSEHTYGLPSWPPPNNTPGSPMAAFPPTTAMSGTSAPMPSFEILPPSVVAAPTSTYLPMFNQMAAQRLVGVDYPAVFSGLPHLGTWNVKCVVNGVQVGEGTGASKQAAKDEAAKQAYFALGWHVGQGSAQPSMPGDAYTSIPPSGNPNEFNTGDTDMAGVSDYPMQNSQNDQAGSGPQPHAQPIDRQPYAPNDSYRSPPSQPAPPLPSSYPPLPPHAYPPLPPPVHTVPKPTYLPIFNQTAAQRRLHIDYPAEFSGPPHAGRWIVKCLVNGVIQGQGQGPNKQLAKEEAAKEAFHAMGWGTYLH